MRIVSVNRSMGELVSWRGREVRTSIFKTPVAGPVQVSKTNIEGDRQSDLTVHGGVDKAVYAYSRGHYDWWEKQLERKLEPAAFGENLTIEGLDEQKLFVGDIVKAGSALLQAVQPRLPCYKLGIKFDDPQMPKRFFRAAKWGVYFRVLQEGILQQGDPIEILQRDPQEITISALAAFASGENGNPAVAWKALQIGSLNESWRETLEEFLRGKEDR